MFKIDTQNLEEQIAYGSGQIYLPVNVDGFWSNPIELRVRREWRWTREWFQTDEPASGGWEFEVSHSSGGKDTKVIDTLTSERNFAMAIIATLDIVEQLKGRVAELEAAYQNRCAINDAEIAEAKALKAARIEADPAVSPTMAQGYVDNLIAMARMAQYPYLKCAMTARVRGEDDECRTTFTAERTSSGRVMLRLNDFTTSRKEAIAALSNLAADSVELKKAD